MKKILGISAVTLSLLSLCSCSSEIDGPVSPSDNSVRITLSMPTEVLSRTFSDGNKVNQLTYAIYEKSEGTLIKSETVNAQFTNGSYTLETELVNGFEYDILFWADKKSETPYFTFNSETKTITMNDNAFVSNIDDVDAFFGKTTTGKITQGFNATVPLSRPFAQVNLGASDMDNTSFIHKFGENVGILTQLEVQAYKEFNILEGKVVETSAADVTYAKPEAPIDTTTEPFPNNSTVNKYVGMHYMFADQDGGVVNLKYHFYTDKDRNTEFHYLEVPNVPVRQNYQTNIFGKIFTSDAKLQIELNAGINSISWPLGATVVNSHDEFISALENAQAGTVILIPEGTEITLDATVSGDHLAGDYIEPSADIEIVVDGTLNFNGVASIAPMEETTVRLSGNGTVNTSSNAILLRAESGNIIVDGGLTFNVNGETGCLGVARTGGSLTVNNTTINSNLTKTSVFTMAEGGQIILNNTTVWSKSAVCLYFNGADSSKAENKAINLTATDCKFINNNETKDWYAFEGSPNKAMQYVFDKCYIASNTGCVHAYKSNSVAIKGKNITQHSALSKFKNTANANDKDMIPVVIEAEAKTLQVSDYSTIYNEWNETDADVATILKKGSALYHAMRVSYYTGPTLDQTTGNVIADSQDTYSWGNITGNFTGGKVMNLNGEIVDKSQFFKYKYGTK